MSIDVDLDQQPVRSGPGGWLGQPRMVAVGVAAVGVLAIAVAAVAMQAWRATPASVMATPSSRSPSSSCPPDLPAAQPVPAFVITETVKGDLFAYEDTGRWTWQVLIWMPSTLADQPGRDLVELQTGSAEFPRLTITTAGPEEIAMHAHEADSMTVFETRLSFGPKTVYGTWVSLRVTSIDMPSGDVVTVSLDGKSVEASAGKAFHAPLSGFGLLFPGPDIKYGSPVFTTAC